MDCRFKARRTRAWRGSDLSRCAGGTSAVALTHPHIQTILNAVQCGLLLVRGIQADDSEGDQKGSDHGMRVLCGVFSPRLLQGHRPAGELQFMDLVENRAGSGETLVKASDPSQHQSAW